MLIKNTIFVAALFASIGSYATTYSCMLAGTEVPGQRAKNYIGKEIWSILITSKSDAIFKDSATNKSYQGKLTSTENKPTKIAYTYCGVDACTDYGVIFLEPKNTDSAPMVVLNTTGIDNTRRYYNCISSN